MSAATANSITVSYTDPITSSADAPDSKIQGQIDHLLAAIAEHERRNTLYRTGSEESEALSMKNPEGFSQAYQRLGFLLGAFPPAAYFIRSGVYDLVHPERMVPGLIVLSLFMNIICMAAGAGFGKVVGKQMEKYFRASWMRMIVFSTLFALLWALVTGFSGGAIVFVIGGFVGATLAAPVALAAFPLFAILLRPLERGLLIERRHLLPITYGISLAICAFILAFH